MDWEEIVHTLPGPGRVDSDFGSFVIPSDHPPEDDRGGRAPTPWSQFLASIGSCMASFVAASCEEAGISCEGIRLVQRQSRREGERRLREFFVEIQVPEGFPEEHRAALVTAASRCTVKHVIECGPRFRIEVR